MTPEELPAVAALAATLPPYDENAVLALTDQLRARAYSADVIAAALTQSRLRARATTKFGIAADRLLFTTDGLEQATRPIVAAHRLRRFLELAPLGWQTCAAVSAPTRGPSPTRTSTSWP